MISRIDKVKRLAKDVAQYVAPERLTACKDDAFFIYSLAVLDDTFHTEDFTKYIERYFERLLYKGLQITEFSQIALGYTCNLMYKKTGNKNFKLILDKIIAFVRSDARDNMPTAKANGGKFVLIEDLLFALPFLAQYARETCNMWLTSYCEKALNFYLDKLFNTKEGLFHSYYNADVNMPFPIMSYWSKGNGFALLGLTELFDYTLGKQRNLLSSVIPKLSCSLWKHVRKDFSYGKQLNAFSVKDSCGNAFIVAGLMKSYAMKMITEDCFNAVEHSFNSLVDSLTLKDGLFTVPDCRDTVSRGFKVLLKGQKPNKLISACGGIIFAAITCREI